MCTIRKTLLALAICAVLTLAVGVATGVAQTLQKYPTRPIRVLVPSGAGSNTDAIARLIWAKVDESWGHPVVVDSRPGRSGVLAANIVAKSAPDGHTLLLTSSFAVSAALQRDLPYDPLKDFSGVTQIGFGTAVLVVTPALGVRSMKDLIALAKAQPGKLIFASSATGTATHLIGARIIRDADIKVISVAFKGPPEAIIEVLAGRSHYSYVPLAPSLPFIKEGKLLALGVSTAQRSRELPDVPALAETLPKFKASGVSFGLLSPAGTAHPILNKIGKEVARILDLPDVKAWFQAAAFVIAPSTPESYDKILREQIETISAIGRDLGLKTR